jgi:hypothetical protein
VIQWRWLARHFFWDQWSDQAWFNDGMQLIDSGQRLTGAARSWDVALGDVNGDGRLDAIVASADPAPRSILMMTRETFRSVSSLMRATLTWSEWR